MTELLTAHITQEDFDTAEALVAEGHSPEEVRELLVGNSKEMTIDGLVMPAQSIGGHAVAEVFKETNILSAPPQKPEWVEAPTRGRN